MPESSERFLNRRLTKNEQGFTLIELLIVIVVLGILAAVVVFALGGVTGQSAQSACNADAKTVETAVAAYQAQVGSAPTTVSSLTTVQSNGQQYLHSWPNNASHYEILLGSITVASGGAAADFDTTFTGYTAPTSFPAAVTAGNVYVTPLGASSLHAQNGVTVAYDSQVGTSGSQTGCFAVQ